MKIDRFKYEYSFLSNFYPVKIPYKGIVYPSVEHAYQASKFEEFDIKRYIADELSAGQAKRYGKIKNVPLLSLLWKEKRLRIMKELLTIKFSFSPLTALLLSTGNDELIEGNTWGDKFWGVCDGEGENYLGKLLMRIREELKDA